MRDPRLAGQRPERHMRSDPPLTARGGGNSRGAWARPDRHDSAPCPRSGPAGDPGDGVRIRGLAPPARRPPGRLRRRFLPPGPGTLGPGAELRPSGGRGATGRRTRVGREHRLLQDARVPRTGWSGPRGGHSRLLLPDPDLRNPEPGRGALRATYGRPEAGGHLRLAGPGAVALGRAIILVLDALGIGAMEDVPRTRPRDSGANTLLHLLEWAEHNLDKSLSLPNLARLGLGKVLEHPALPADADGSGTVVGSAALGYP